MEPTASSSKIHNPNHPNNHLSKAPHHSKPTISLVNPIIWVWEPLLGVAALVNGRGGGKGFGYGWDWAWERKREGEVERGFAIHGGLLGTQRSRRGSSREAKVKEGFGGSFPPDLLQTTAGLALSLSLSLSLSL